MDEMQNATERFLSTPSGWRATGILSQGSAIVGISIHALRVEGDEIKAHGEVSTYCISIHALRVEGDVQIELYTKDKNPISIHALRVEGDRRAFAFRRSR